MIRRARAELTALLFLLSASSAGGTGCARSPAARAFGDGSLRAERALTGGRHEEARRLFRDLERTATSQADVVYARMRLAESYRLERRYREAERILAGLARARLPAETAAKVHYHLGRLLLDAGEQERGEERLDLLVQKLPDTAYGHRAFLYLRGAYRARDPAFFVAWCRRRYRQLGSSTLADNLLYEAGHVHFERGTEADDARAATFFGKILDRWGFQTSSVWDDALWELSLIHHRRGRFREEVDLLERFLATLEEAGWLGSYEHQNYKQAHFRLGRIHYEDLRDYARAAAIFEDLPRAFPKSRLLDDALFWRGHALRRAGREEEASRVFEKLLREHPDSKYARRVREGAPGP